MAVSNTNNTASTSSFSYLQFKNKIGGLVSGIDVNSVMEKLMKAESAQMEKLQQQKQKYEWKRDAYREVNTSLAAFEKGMWDDFGLSKNWSSKTVSSTDSQNRVTATASPTAGGTLNITEAVVAKAGSVKNANTTTYSSSQTLEELGGVTASGTFKFTVGTTEKSIDFTKDDTVDSLVAKLNNAGVNAFLDNGKLVMKSEISVSSTETDSIDFANKLGFTLDGQGKIASDSSITVTTTANSLTNLTPKTTLSSLGLQTGTFKITGLNSNGDSFVEKEISFKDTDTVESLLNKINSSGAGVTAVMSGSSISLTSNTPGTGVSGMIMGVTQDDQGVFKKLGFFDKDASNTGQFALTGQQNGSLTVNGVKVEQSSNNYSIAGYNIAVNQDIAAGSNINVSSSNNTEDLVGKVKSFVDTYNGLVKSLSDKTNEKRNITFSPLTDAQKAEMTKEEIEKWEEKAKAGSLRSDSAIKNVLATMREKLYSTVGTDTLYSIGITTTKTYADGGQLEIDEDKLSASLEKDPNVLARIFTGNGEDKGIISSLRDAAKGAIKSIEKSAGNASAGETSYSLGKNIIAVDDRIDNWKDRLKSIEERYWKQFSIMENAVQKANSQSSIFAG